MVSSAKTSLYDLGYAEKKTVSVKIRIHKDLRETIDFIKTVEAAGADFITIHGRLRSTPSSHPVDRNAIKLLAEHTTIPTISNGDVFTLSDAQNHAKALGVDGVMSARGLLQNPALFAGFESCPWEAVEFFMNKVAIEPIPFKLVVHHLSEMCGTDHSQCRAGGGALFDKETRRGLMECGNMIELIDWLDSVRELKRLR
jgi:tRNA-dihydrouridine synthase 4